MRNSEKLYMRLLREAGVVFVKEVSKDAARSVSNFVKRKIKKMKEDKEKEGQE